MQDKTELYNIFKLNSLGDVTKIINKMFNTTRKVYKYKKSLSFVLFTGILNR